MAKENGKRLGRLAGEIVELCLMCCMMGLAAVALAGCSGLPLEEGALVEGESDPPQAGGEQAPGQEDEAADEEAEEQPAAPDLGAEMEDGGEARLYIANLSGNSVISYGDPASVNGNIAPDTVLRGADTKLVSPTDIIVTDDGVLIASNQALASLTSYEDAPTTNGNLEPDGLVQGAATQLTLPTSLAVNANEDLAFVANILGGSITVYENASGASFNGNLPPVRTINSADLAGPIGINFGADDDLYVANSGSNTVAVFANASNLNGVVSATRVISSPLFDAIFDVFIDGLDNMYVVDSFDSEVLIFNNASSLNGEQLPDFTLSVPGAGFLTAMAVDSNDTGYIVDFTLNAVYSYDDMSTINGTFTPDRTIKGDQTQMVRPIRVFLDE